MHDPSPAHDALVAAWATSCRRAGTGPVTGRGTISGRVRLLRRNGSPGKAIAKATVTVGALSQRAKRRKPKGGYAFDVAAGTYAVSAAAGRRVCHVGTPDGPQALQVVVTDGAAPTIDVFCSRP
jgi:hypothetical protein